MAATTPNLAAIMKTSLSAKMKGLAMLLREIVVTNVRAIW